MDVTEVWRPIVGWEEVYDVSSWGRVRRRKAAPGTSAGLVLNPVIGNRGYRVTTLYDRARRETRTVHSLVAAAFLGPRPCMAEVNHVDHDRTNNRVNNLEYVSRQQNHDHAKRAGRLKGGGAKGERSHRAKLTSEDVVWIRQAYPTGQFTMQHVATRLGITKQAVCRIIHRQTWKHLP